MCAKLSRKIINMTDDEYRRCHALLLLTLRTDMSNLEGVETKKLNSKKKHAINNLNKWFSMKKEADK